MHALRLLWDAWDRWWFSACDPRVLASMRIGWGLLLLWLYAPMWGELEWMFTEQGTYPLDARDADMEVYRWSAYSALGLETLGEVRLLFGATLLVFFLVTIGLGSRVVVPLAWIAILSMINRNAVWTDGSDAMMRVFGFYMMLMPTGRAWSVDALIRSRRKGPVPPPPSSWPLRLFQLQVCVLYVKTGVVKALDSRWQDGVAVFHALSNASYHRFPMDEFLAAPAFHWWTTAATYGTLVFEILFPLVFLRRLRRWWLLAGVCLHMGIFVFLNIGGFSEAILWTYLAFLVFPERPR